jgi:hypothetical protein
MPNRAVKLTYVLMLGMASPAVAQDNRRGREIAMKVTPTHPAILLSGRKGIGKMRIPSSTTRV